LFGSEYSSQEGRKSPRGGPKIFPGGQLPPTSRAYAIAQKSAQSWANLKETLFVSKIIVKMYHYIFHFTIGVLGFVLKNFEKFIL